jgi:hypothetical protein
MTRAVHARATIDDHEVERPVGYIINCSSVVLEAVLPISRDLRAISVRRRAVHQRARLDKTVITTAIELTIAQR